MELCTGGSLAKYLREHKGRTKPEEKLRFCIESASGMAYISRCGVLHRDVAARNVLLTLPERTVKISDFGRS